MPSKALLLFALALATIFVASSRLMRAQDAKPATERNQPSKSGSLSSEDRQLLDRLLKEFIFDPQGAKYVALTVKVRDDSGTEVDAARQGWWIAGNAGQPDRVYLSGDGNLVTLPTGTKVENIDFIALCRKRYTPRKASDTPNASAGNGESSEFDTIFDLLNATWLHRLGEDKLASEALERAREQVPEPVDGNAKQPAANPDAAMVAGVEAQLANFAYQTIIRAYIVRADEEALAQDKRLLKQYPKQAKQLAQPEAILLDLERRHKNGSFGKAPPTEWPQDYYAWDAARKIGYLLEALDELEIHQQSRPGYSDLLQDRRIGALLNLGDAAVPALIDTIEHDERMTRSIFDSCEAEQRPMLLSVRQAALVAVLGILRVRVFKPNSADRMMTVHATEDASRIAGLLRTYWKTYGGLSFEARMMKMLSDPQCMPADWRDAAYNLGYRRMRRMIDCGGVIVEMPDGPSQATSLVARFSQPTAAEAMLAAMDRELTAHEAEPVPKSSDDPDAKAFLAPLRKQADDQARREIEDAYLAPLMQLHDSRIAPELARRYRAARTIRVRCQLALAAHLSGDSAPLKQFCREFQEAKLGLPQIPEIMVKLDSVADRGFQQQVSDLFEIIALFIRSHLPEADRALFALADPKHPQNKLVVRMLLWDHFLTNFGLETSAESDVRQLAGHPYCLAVLRHELDNTQPTGVVYRIKGEMLEASGGGYATTTQPNYLTEFGPTRDQAPQRICDLAAWEIGIHAWGMPVTHELLKDSERRLKEMKRVLDRYQSRYRLATKAEMNELNDGPMLIPVLAPLGRAATVDDVAKGLAIFELDGRGKIAPLKLLAAGTVKASNRDNTQETILVLQAEIGADGKTLYGAVGRHILRTFVADELTEVKPLDSAEPQ